MKKIFIILVSIGMLTSADAQNIGIGIPNPTYPLTVASNSNGIGIVQKGMVYRLAGYVPLGSFKLKRPTYQTDISPYG